MEFIINIQQKSVMEMAKKIEYVIHSHHENNFSMARQVGSGAYPCFHLHITMINGGETGYKFVLHLDRRKMSDDRDCAHHGEYRGEKIQKEMGRIKAAIDALDTSASE